MVLHGIYIILSEEILVRNLYECEEEFQGCVEHTKV